MRAAYSEVGAQRNRRKRSRKIIYFTPPWSNNVATNISRMFQGLVAKHFKKGTLMGRLFNKNNLKVSYSCTRNVKSILAAHNKKVLRESEKRRGGEDGKCNCRGGPGNCPAGGVCMTEEVVYEATVTAPGVEEKRYFGSAATSLKLRVNNHKCDFRNRGRQHSTTLSTHVWSLKDQGLEPEVRYRIVARAKAYSPVTRRCGLCVAEKLAIAKGDPRFMLNKRSEIAGKCRHKNKHVLASRLV